jgi:hypothetical protein
MLKLIIFGNFPKKILDPCFQKPFRMTKSVVGVDIVVGLVGV